MKYPFDCRFSIELLEVLLKYAFKFDVILASSLTILEVMVYACKRRLSAALEFKTVYLIITIPDPPFAPP